MKRIFILSGTSWHVPVDWNSADNRIETIGGGGGTSSGGNDGGGLYSKITNLCRSPGAMAAYRVGGGAPNTAGGNTWFNGATFGGASVGARGGAGPSEVAGGRGGQASSGVGTTKFSGGDRGTSANANNGGAGGRAAGPNGARQAGGSSSQNSGSGGGAGATTGADGFASFGGRGGTAQGGTAGSAGGSSGIPATAGSRGSGGGGAASTGVSTDSAGGNGVGGIEFDDDRGAGGGGGFNLVDGSGGDGGLYGGTGFAPGANIGGAGGQGITVIFYTLIVSNSITADASIPIELATTTCRNDLDPIQSLSSTRRTAALPAEASRIVCRGALGSIELASLVRSRLVVYSEWSGLLSVTAGALSRLEWRGGLRSKGAGAMEFGCRVSQEIINPAEWLVIGRIYRMANLEHAAAMVVKSGPVAEFSRWVVNGVALRAEGLCSLTSEASLRLAVLTAVHCNTLLSLDLLMNGIGVFPSELLFLEWADPHDLMAVSTDRLLRSPGRIRVLAGPDSRHPTKGQ